jgi:hypothetical protein
LLCLEGDSELIAVPRIARVLDLDLESLGVGLFNLHGRGGVRRIPELLGYLRQIGVRPYLVLDSEHDVGEMMLELEKQSLLQKGWATVWPADFEDLFGPEMISEACASLGLTGITPQVLAGSTRFVKSINEVLYRTGQGALNKPELAAQLAAQCEADRARIPLKIRELFAEVKKQCASFRPD